MSDAERKPDIAQQVIERIRQRTDKENYARVLACSQVDPVDGVVYRARLERVKCGVCKMPRWNDGTRCATPWCKSYTTARFKADDEREG